MVVLELEISAFALHHVVMACGWSVVAALNANAAPGSPQLEFHRKDSTHVHVQPAIPRRAFSGVLPPRTSTIGTQADLAAPGAPPAERVVLKSNAWMDVGKKLQRTRDDITAAANMPDPEPPPPPPADGGASARGNPASTESKPRLTPSSLDALVAQSS